MESDIDLLVITDPKANPDMTDEAVDRLAADIRKWTGNNVQIVDRNPEELAAMIASDDPLVASWRADHIDLMGARLLDLLRDLQRAS
jgi:predicted nucleotidyltransferase